MRGCVVEVSGGMSKGKRVGYVLCVMCYVL